MQHADFQIFHIYCESNTVADGLARLASSQRQSAQFSFSTLPTYLKGLVSLDKVSYPYFRRICMPQLKMNDPCIPL